MYGCRNSLPRQGNTADFRNCRGLLVREFMRGTIIAYHDYPHTTTGWLETLCTPRQGVEHSKKEGPRRSRVTPFAPRQGAQFGYGARTFRSTSK